MSSLCSASPVALPLSRFVTCSFHVLPRVVKYLPAPAVSMAATLVGAMAMVREALGSSATKKGACKPICIELELKTSHPHNSSRAVGGPAVFAAAEEVILQQLGLCMHGSGAAILAAPAFPLVPTPQSAANTCGSSSASGAVTDPSPAGPKSNATYFTPSLSAAPQQVAGAPPPIGTLVALLHWACAELRATDVAHAAVMSCVTSLPYLADTPLRSLVSSLAEIVAPYQGYNWCCIAC